MIKFNWWMGHSKRWTITNNKIEQCNNVLEWKLLDCGLSLRRFGWIILPFLVLIWDDKMPIWWTEVRGMTQALWLSMRLPLTFWQFLRRGSICFWTPATCGWPKLGKAKPRASGDSRIYKAVICDLSMYLRVSFLVNIESDSGLGILCDSPYEPFPPYPASALS